MDKLPRHTLFIIKKTKEKVWNHLIRNLEKNFITVIGLEVQNTMTNRESQRQITKHDSKTENTAANQLGTGY